MTKPLAGIKVIELANFIAGPLCGTLLADMGADVIKVEPPKGDMARATPPIRNGESVSFVALNRNKRSLVLDLKQPEAVDGAAGAGAPVGRADRGLPAGCAGETRARRGRGEGGQSADRLHVGVGLRTDRPVSPARRRQSDHRSVFRHAVGDRRARQDADAPRRADGGRVRRAVCDLRHAVGTRRRRADRRRFRRGCFAGRGVDRRRRVGSGRLSRDRQGAAAARQPASAERALSAIRMQGRALCRDRHLQRPAFRRR